MVLPVLGGLFMGDWIRRIWEGRETWINPKNDSRFMFGYRISDEAFEVIKENEGFVANAYVVKGENFYTIGYGTTRLFSKDGKTSRAVKSTDKLTKEEAVFHLKMYYNSSESPKNGLDSVIRTYGYNLNQKFYDMLCMTIYASPGFVKSQLFRHSLLSMLQKAHNNTNVEYLAKLLKDNYVHYLKNYTKGLYKRYGLGWSRRVFCMAQYILGENFSYNNAYHKVKAPY